MQTRQFSEATWKKVLTKANAVPASVTTKPFIHVPLCIGYDQGVSKDEFALINDQLKNQTYEYRFYLFPSQVERHQESVKAFFEHNANLIAELQKAGRLYSEAEWRQTSEWHNAKSAYDNYYNLDKNNDIAEKMNKILADDLAQYCKRSLQSETPELRQTVIDEVVDVISFASPASPDARLNIVLHPAKMHNSMRHAMQKLKDMGYADGSVEYVEAKLEPAAKLTNTPAPVRSRADASAKTSATKSRSPSPVESGSSDSENEDVRDAILGKLIDGVLAKGPVYAAEFADVIGSKKRRTKRPGASSSGSSSGGSNSSSDDDNENSAVSAPVAIKSGKRTSRSLSGRSSSSSSPEIIATASPLSSHSMFAAGSPRSTLTVPQSTPTLAATKPAFK